MFAASNRLRFPWCVFILRNGSYHLSSPFACWRWHARWDPLEFQEWKSKFELAAQSITWILITSIAFAYSYVSHTFEPTSIFFSSLNCNFLALTFSGFSKSRASLINRRYHPIHHRPRLFDLKHHPNRHHPRLIAQHLLQAVVSSLAKKKLQDLNYLALPSATQIGTDYWMTGTDTSVCNVLMKRLGPDTTRTMSLATVILQGTA